MIMNIDLKLYDRILRE